MDVLVLFYPYFIFLVSTYIIWRVSDSFDLAASYLTRDLKPGIKGPTVNAVASSLPELLISFIFLFQYNDISGFSAGFATIVGSSIFNIAMIPAIAFLVIYYQGKSKEFITYRNIILQDGAFLLIAELMLLGALFFAGVSLEMAVLLIGIYLIYIIYIYKKRMGGNKVDEANEYIDTIVAQSWIRNLVSLNLFALLSRKRTIDNFNAFSVALASILFIGCACYMLVGACEHISDQVGVDIFVVGFVVAAIASSFPDTLLSIKDAQKGKYMDAFSNAFGSNIFDICIGIGLPVLVYLLVNDMDGLTGIANAELVLSSASLLVLFTVLICFLYWIGNLKLWNSILIIGLYFLFVWMVLYLSNNDLNILNSL